MLTRNNKGVFVRTRNVWTFDTWDDGYVDNRGRFRVYRPDCPRVYALGYALRAHVVWWLTTGQTHPSGTVLHHINEIKTDDRFDNLKILPHGAHSSMHASKPEYKVCAFCSKEFPVQHRGKKRRLTMKYCSYECFRKMPVTDAHKANIALGLARAYAEGRR